jgi:ParB/RepB/Spo0J family partition protein
MIQRNSIKNLKKLTETPVVTRLHRNEIVLDPDQPRKKNKHTPATLKALGKTMKTNGQEQPIKVRPHPNGGDLYMVVFGEGRWLASAPEYGDVEELDCIITYETDINKIRVMQITENLMREGMSDYDIAQSFRDLIDLGAFENATALAEHLGLSDATVSVYLSVLDAPQEIQQLANDNIATIDTALTLAKVHELNPARAEEIIEAGRATGKVKRDDVRAAYGEEKAAAGKAEKRGRKPKADKGEAPKADGKEDGAGSGETVVWPFSAASNGAPSVPVEQHASTSETPVVAGKIAVAACDIFVSIDPSSTFASEFDGDVVKHGSATLADGMVNSDPAIAWVRFGGGTDTEKVAPYPCGDLKIQRIVRRD